MSFGSTEPDNHFNVIKSSLKGFEFKICQALLKLNLYIIYINMD